VGWESYFVAFCREHDRWQALRSELAAVEARRTALLQELASASNDLALAWREDTSFRVFISYKHTSETADSWVMRLCRDLIEIYGLRCLLDRYDLMPGDSIPQFMQRIATESTHVVFVISPAAMKALSAGEGGLSFEADLWTTLRTEGRVRVIPILRDGSEIPAYVRAYRYLDFRDDGTYNKALKELHEAIVGDRGRPMPNTRLLER
jgi:hypothetical protein